MSSNFISATRPLPTNAQVKSSYTVELKELDWSPEDIESCLDPFLYGYRDPPKASPSAITDRESTFSPILSSRVYLSELTLNRVQTGSSS